MLLLSPLLLTACVIPGDTVPSDNPLTCTDSGKTTVNIFYGDSQLKVSPQVVRVHKNKMIQFALHPQKAPATDPEGVDYDEVTVTVTGKKTDGNWLNVSGDSKSGKKLQVCAPDPGGVKVVTYEYMVTVQEVGQLDPRAEVDPQ
jgi:hypothetical protein